MALADLTDPESVVRAVREFDHLGRDAIFAKYSFGRSRSYFLILDRQSYDSKAIAGASHGYQHPTLGPLPELFLRDLHRHLVVVEQECEWG